MTTIGYATLQLIPSLRGAQAQIDRQSRGLKVHADVDVTGAREAGRRAGRGIQQGLAGSRIAAGLHRQVDEELSSSAGARTGSRYGASLAGSILASVLALRAGFSAVSSAGGSVLRHVGAIATGTKIASIAARGLSHSLLAAGGALALLGGGTLGKLAIGLRMVSRFAGIAARDIGRITASLIVLTAVARGISALNRLGKIAAVGTIGFSALLGVATGVATLMGGPMVAALTAVGAAMGVAAGAAAGILGPALAVAGLAFKGLQDAATAYTSSDGGAGQAKAVAAAAKQVEQAEKGVERAKRDSRDAERDLTRAREDAAEQIEDLNLQLRGAALSEKDAQLSLLEARRDLQQLGQDGEPVDMIDRERAVLRVQEAEQRLAETQESNGDLAAETAEANRLGVEGSDEVVAARERVADANQAVIDSQEQLADAMQAVADAQSQGQSGVDPFDAMIGQRIGPALDAVKRLRQAITDSLTTALAPAIGTFSGMLDGLSPKLVGLSGLFGTLGVGIAESLSGPEARQGFDDMIAGSTEFFSAFKGENGLGGLISGLVSFAGTAAKTFAGVGDGINGALASLGDWLANISADQMVATFDRVRQIFENIGNVVGPIVSALRELGGISAPALAPGFQAVGTAIGQATPGIMTMARELMPALGQGMQNLAPVLPAIVDAFTPWASVVAVLVPHLATMLSHLGPLAPIILGVALAAKGIGAAIIVWNAAAAAGSVALGIHAAATGASTASLGTNTIALGAHRVAMLIGTAATGLGAAAMTAFGAALRFAMGPIGLIITAVTAIGAGLVLLYNKNETFRNIVQAVWAAVRAAVEAVVTWFTDTAWPFLQRTFDAVVEGFGWIGDKAEAVGTWVVEKFTTMVDWIKNIPTAITKVGKGMWNGLMFGLVDVLNWIGDKWNAFADALSFNIPNPFGDDINIEIPKLPKFVVTQDQLMFSRGGYTGDVPVNQIAGYVHGDEFVTKASSRRRIEANHPGLLDHMNQYGRLPGFFTGGRVPGFLPGGRVPATAPTGGVLTEEMVKQIAADFGLQVTSEDRPGDSGYHGQGLALDVSNGTSNTPQMEEFAQYMAKNFGSALLELIYDSPTFTSTIKDGRAVGRFGEFYTLGQAGPHNNHVHVAANWGNVTIPDNTATSPTSQWDTPDTDTVVETVTPETQAAVDASTGATPTDSAASTMPTTLAGLSTWGLDSLGITTQASPESPARTFEFGKAISAAIGGQVSSLASVFGIPDPSWLEGIGKFMGEFSVSPNASAAPNATSLPDGQHTGTGVAPGPDGPATAPTSPVAAVLTAPAADYSGGTPQIRNAVYSAFRDAGFTDAMWSDYVSLVNHESGWNPEARNPSSDAYGLAQFLGQGNVNKYLGGSNRDVPVDVQAKGMMQYIIDRYGDPTKAWAFWQDNNWYAEGGWTGPGRKLDMAGIVHADEFVTKASSRRRIEAKHPGFLDYMNDTGELPGYAGGGTVGGGAKGGSTGGFGVQDFWSGAAGAGLDVALATVKGFMGAAPRQVPQVQYNIQARDTEDAFIRAQRQERERAVAKLSRF